MDAYPQVSHLSRTKPLKSTADFPEPRRLAELPSGSGLKKKLTEKPNRAVKGLGTPLTGTLTRIDGKVYDLGPFLSRHPGGSDLLMMAIGRDASVMFHSYHLDKEKAMKYLKPLEIEDGERAFHAAEPVQLGVFEN